MSKIVIFGARGRLGRLTVAEALGRGHEVTAVTRDGTGLEPTDGLRIAVGDIVDPDGVAALAIGHEVGISTIGPREGDGPRAVLRQRPGAARRAAPGRRVARDHRRRRRLLGGGTGQVAHRHAGLPGARKPTASSAVTALRRLRASETPVDWAFMSPAFFFDADGERTGKYRLGTDNLISDDEGSYLSYADGAVVLIDEVEEPRHHFTRFTVGR